MKPPHWALALSEAPRVVVEAGALALLKSTLAKKLPRGDGHGVMVIPGFMGDDPFNQSLVDFLNALGYRASGWQMGRNLGPGSFSEDDLQAKIARLARAGGGQISLIGHSLGGIYAREIARREPTTVRQVISLGSPFGEGRDTGSNASRLYRKLNPKDDADPDRVAQQKVLSTAPPVPTTSIYTKADGVVNWRTAIQEPTHQQTENIQVAGSHCGLTLNPAVWYLIANRLPQTESNWAPFESAMFNHH
ncbi:MAG: pimeloyl-ACP methyl ester carboxylesterase [Halioglobus sp.]|jgi:pimeloyl-ACP methyl ester carboxylesterase